MTAAEQTVDADATARDSAPTEDADGADTADAESAFDDADAAAVSADRIVAAEDRYTGRWNGVAAAALLAVGVGAIAQSPAAFLLGVFGVAYAAYARMAEPPAVDLRVEREFGTDRPDPGEAVDVTVRITNEGASIPDLRVVDGVPDQIHVVEGTPRLAADLGAGETVELQYAVGAERGRHEFDHLRAIARGYSGAVERDADVQSATDDELYCTPGELPPSTNLSLQSLTTPYAGRVETDIGGDGAEFYATREYQRGDPLSRVDWNRKARTGELSTIEFREERAASVVLLIDVRVESWLRPDAASPSAVERSVEGAMQVFSSLIEGGDRVGVAVLGATDPWLPPGSGEDHRAAARRLFVEHPLLTPESADDLIERPISVDSLRKQLPSHSQVILFSPLCDDGAVEQATLLEAAGHRVTAVSPDPTATATAGQSVAHVERELRLSELRRTGARVVDWRWEEPLAAAISRAGERWSA
ncbi:Uncharacterized conserved protein, DUF58 family, contains vWF domain [Natronoarchaeum philippinense]|uniref:Uncharacterized conserved protein, DUF58 family, contains vWF domain n=1 Tax=Natronoarchaeum philippinense TaxID=558529 RepID=A0A285NBC2_NATPI|nr:DUF58 domain-containing protein [Natronoarchaeum philippinense]SNZ04981.1 Uncharacterized conserved protein, DUF58 family, contains vWF domain [Natronoarchaeum philippinense]